MGGSGGFVAADGLGAARRTLVERWLGGPHDGLPFATKGGLIGAADATSLCLEYLLTARVRRAIRRRATIERSAGVAHEKEETTWRPVDP